MKLRPALLATLGTAAIATAGIALAPDTRSVAPQAIPSSAEPDPAGNDEETLVGTVDPLGTAMARYEGVLDKAFKPIYVDYSESRYDGKVFARYGDLVPIQMKFDNCRDSAEGFVCDEVSEFDHPYHEYSFSDLRSIAEFDAAASFILGYRIFADDTYKQAFEGDTWYQAGVDSLLNAAVLSGSQQPYVTMMMSRRLMGLAFRASPSGWNDLEQTYIWSKTGIDLGYLDPDWPGYHSALDFIRHEMGDDAQAMIEDLNEKTEGIKKYLTDKKARTTG